MLLVGFFVAVPALLSSWVYRPRFLTSDFALYYRDARVGWLYGWAHMYDLAGFTQVTQQLGIHNHDPAVPSLSLPWLTWLVAPFALLPFTVAYIAWLVLMVLAIMITWLMLAPNMPVGKGWHLLLVAAFLPLVFGVMLGSAVVLVILAVAIMWRLVQQERTVAAGLVLALALVRPQVCMLVPICFLAAGRRRLFLAFLAGTAVLAAVAVAIVPLPELQAYASRLFGAAQQPKTWDVASELSLASVRPIALAMVISLAVIGMAVSASVLARASEYRDAVALTAGIVGSLLIAPYIHVQDEALLLLLIWVWLQRLPAALSPLLVFPVVFAANLEMSIHSLLLVALEVLGLGLLGVQMFASRHAVGGAQA